MDVDDDAAYEQPGAPDKRSVPMALSVDDAASQRGRDDDEASHVYDCAHGLLCGGEGQVYCTHYSGGCYGKPRRCPRGLKRSLEGICCSSDEAPGRRMSCWYLFR